jgi:hypothetical protein
MSGIQEFLRIGKRHRLAHPFQGCGAAIRRARLRERFGEFSLTGAPSTVT